MLFHLLSPFIRHVPRSIINSSSMVMYSTDHKDDISTKPRVTYQHLSRGQRSDIQYMIDNSIEYMLDNSIHPELVSRPTYNQIRDELDKCNKDGELSDAQRKAIKYMIDDAINKAIVTRPTYNEMIDQIIFAVELELRLRQD